MFLIFRAAQSFAPDMHEKKFSWTHISHPSQTFLSPLFFLLDKMSHYFNFVSGTLYRLEVKHVSHI